MFSKQTSSVSYIPFDDRIFADSVFHRCESLSLFFGAIGFTSSLRDHYGGLECVGPNAGIPAKG